MFRNSYQHGYMSILYSCGSSPLELWDMHVKNGYIRRVTDDEVKSLALEIAGTNVATTYIYCPADPKKVLAIKLPFLVMIIKNMKKYFTFEITILDDKNMHRRFRVSNFQSTTRVRPFCTSMPIGLTGGWNQIQFNLADFTRRAYGSNYVETTRMQIHANCRIRRIYFADRLYSEDELPEEYNLFLPIHRKKCVRSEAPGVKKPGAKDKAVSAGLPAEPPAFVAEKSTGEPEVTAEEPAPEVVLEAPAPSEDVHEEADTSDQLPDEAEEEEKYEVAHEEDEVEGEEAYEEEEDIIQETAADAADASEMEEGEADVEESEAEDSPSEEEV